jgi:hypothetical protein
MPLDCKGHEGREGCKEEGYGSRTGRKGTQWRASPDPKNRSSSFLCALRGEFLSFIFPAQMACLSGCMTLASQEGRNAGKAGYLPREFLLSYLPQRCFPLCVKQTDKHGKSVKTANLMPRH